MKHIFLILICSATLLATSYLQNQNGNWHTTTTFTPNGTPGFGDTITNNQYTLTCETGQTCPIGTVNATALTLGDGTHAASLIVNGTLVIRGQGTMNGPFYDCTHSPSLVIGSGGTLSLDENGGSVASGFLIPPSTAPCVQFLFGTSGDTCNWATSPPTCPTSVDSINNGSANGILLTDSGTGFGASITDWNGTQISNCGGGGSTPCYQVEMYQASGTAWNWKQVSLVADNYFGANAGTGVESDSIPVHIDSTVSSGVRIGHTDIYFGSECTHGAYSPSYVPACLGNRSVTNSLLRDMRYDGASGDPFTAGAMVANVYWDDLGTGNYPTLTAANIAGGSWSYVVAYSDASTCGENTPAYTAPLVPTIDHVYALCSATTGAPILLSHVVNKNWGTDVSLSNAIFDLETDGTGSAGHCYIYGNDGSADNGYSVSMSYITVLRNAALGYGCGFTAWSSVCPAAPTASITHALQPYAGYSSQGTMYFCEADVNATPPALSVFQGNIYYDTSQRSNPLVFGGDLANATQPANVVPPTGIDYNVNFNFVPFVTTRFTAACAPGCTNGGSPYAVPMTGSAPGPHDLDINPGLQNNTLNGYTWAIANGQPGSAAGFRQVFINGGPSVIGANIAALFYYINRGNIPTRTLWNAMPDGSTIGPSQPVMFPGDIRTVTQ